MDSGLVVGLIIALAIIVVAIPSSEEKARDRRYDRYGCLDGCDCEICREKRSRGIILDLLVRDLGMDLYEKSKDDPVLRAVEGGIRLSIRPGGSSLGFTVVDVRLPDSMPALPEFLLRRRVSIADSSGFQGVDVPFDGDDEFSRTFSLRVKVAAEGIGSNASGFAAPPEVSTLRERFSHELRARLLENAKNDRWWVIGARGRILEAHISKLWEEKPPSYRGLTCEAVWMMLSIALGRSISREALISWKAANGWSARDLVAGLMAGRGYDEEEIRVRRPEVLLRRDLMRGGLSGAETVSDPRFIRAARESGYLFDGAEQCVHLEKHGVSMRLSLCRLAGSTEDVGLITLLTVVLPAAKKRLQPFRLVPKDLESEEQTANRGSDELVWGDDFEEVFDIKRVGGDVGEGFEGVTIDALFNESVRSYFTRPDVFRRAWVVEGYGGLLEIHQGRLVEFEPQAFRRFINEAAAVGMVLLSSGRILPDAYVEPSLFEETESVSDENPDASDSVQLPPAIAPSAGVRERARLTIALFEEKLVELYPAKMSLFRLGLSPSEQKRHLGDLYQEYARTGKIPEL